MFSNSSGLKSVYGRPNYKNKAAFSNFSGMLFQIFQYAACSNLQNTRGYFLNHLFAGSSAFPIVSRQPGHIISKKTKEKIRRFRSGKKRNRHA